MAHGSHRYENDKKEAGKHSGFHSNHSLNHHDGHAMSEYMEIINPQTMIAKLLHNGEIVEEYKVEQCDKCSKLTKLDSFGYQKGYGNEKIIWFCGGCR